MGRRLAALRDASLAVRNAVLLAAILVVLAVAAPIGWALNGWLGAAAAAIAAACCWSGTAVAMLLTDLLRDPKNLWIGWMLGTVPRMGAPMVLALVARIRGGPLFDAGLLYYLLVFYPVALTLETVMSLPQLGESSATKGRETD